MESAIRLSLAALAALAAECEKAERGIELNEHSVSDLYSSLCVLENHQIAPVSVLSRMWSVSESNAQKVCILLSSMSLAKTSKQTLDGREQYVLVINCMKGAI